MGERTFTIWIEGQVTLSVSDIWPNGDAPADPQVEDVESVLADAGSLPSVMHDWNLADDFEWSVSKSDDGGGNG